jgi:bifunctional enzyme CysN/CysC/sulfate adenylyltransferase subunit 1
MGAERDLIATDIEGYLRRYQEKDLLRFVTVGSVDDGKSTLIGRLLYDTGSVYTDQLEAVRAATHAAGLDLDLSLLTDGLAAEREQGITIDVAYRYFSTERRKYIIADTPGHVQYTRNMVTGASTAHVALILIDARLGVLQQSRRHAYIASLLGIEHLAVCVNKMDLVSYERAPFDKIGSEFRAFTSGLAFSSVAFVPISATTGVNCVRASDKTPWYTGPTVLGFLESVPVQEGRDLGAFRYPVQYVTRPNLDYRGYAGRIASGVVRKGDTVTILPSLRTSRIKAIDMFDGELAEAFAAQSVTIRLDDELDVSRGDMLVSTSDRPSIARTLDAHLVWLHETPLDAQKSYLLKHTTQVVRADVEQVLWRKDMDTLDEIPASTLALNDIGRVRLAAHRPLFVDPYAVNRETGSFILMDPITNATVAAGMILAAEEGHSAHEVELRMPGKSTRPSTGGVTPVAVLTGASAGERDILARAIENRLHDLGLGCVVVRCHDVTLGWGAARAILDADLVAVLIVDAAGAEPLPSARWHGRAIPLVVRLVAGESGLSPVAGKSGAAAEADPAVATVLAGTPELSAEAVVHRLRTLSRPG